jgi:hypothetical protein
MEISACIWSGDIDSSLFIHHCPAGVFHAFDYEARIG